MDQNQEQLNLNLSDITLALQIIQVAASRGVFKTEEYSEIGGCYDRIFKFLEASGAIVRNDAPAESTAEQSAEQPTTKKPATKSKGKTK